MKLLGIFSRSSLPFLHSTLFLLSVLISCFLALDSRYSVRAFRVLQLEFIYFYCFCSFSARIYEQRTIYLYIDIYMFRVGSVLRQFYSILFCFTLFYFIFLLRMESAQRSKKYRSLSRFVNENEEEIIYFFFAQEEDGGESGRKAKDKRQHSILFCTKF